MKQVVDILPDGEHGIARVSRYEFKNKDNPFYNLRSIIRGDAEGYIHDGTYVTLHVGETLMMSDTYLELKTNWEFCNRAHGDVLIAGLGVGLILHNIRDKVEKGIIKSITVVEKYQDVITLVGPYYPFTKCICADIFDKDIPGVTDRKWDTIYFDIWPNRCTENLEQIKILHNRFKFKLNRPDGWMNSWYKERLQALRRKENELLDKLKMMKRQWITQKK